MHMHFITLNEYVKESSNCSVIFGQSAMLLLKLNIHKISMEATKATLLVYFFLYGKPWYKQLWVWCKWYKAMAIREWKEIQ